MFKKIEKINYMELLQRDYNPCRRLTVVSYVDLNTAIRAGSWVKALDTPGKVELGHEIHLRGFTFISK